MWSVPVRPNDQEERAFGTEGSALHNRENKYLAHAAGAELSKNAVVRDGFAEQDSPDWGCILRGHGDGVNEVALFSGATRSLLRGRSK